jgi:thiamine pyrophosphate-dependent acetolactate synthase large subunit-like protein
MTMLTKHQLLEPLSRLRGDAVIVTTMGVVRPWGKYSSSELDFASADSAMGHAADLALGIALAQPQRKVICLNGDGSMLMTLGTLVTITAAGAQNLVLFVVQNGTYEITGNQPIPACGEVDFSAFARGAGFERIYRFEKPDEYAESLPEVLSGAGPVFAAVVIEAGSEGPISRSEREQSFYLKPSLAEWGQRMRRALQSQEKRKDIS